MKKLLTLLAAVALVGVLCGCSKDTRCRCQAVDAVDAQGRPLVTYFNVESGSMCKKITKVGFEQLLEGKLVRDIYLVKCERSSDDNI
ncbi:MAG: hypothetical protein IJ785_05920 [Bacteroidales bacterium]|nr:hypothetical protein [Bacteroidales bacterium]